MVNTYERGDILPEQAGEDVKGEELDHEDNAYREGPEDENVEEEKVVGFDEPENSTI